MPDLFITNSITATNHINFITTIATTAPNVPTSSPQTQQRFLHLTITAATANSSLNAHNSQWGRQGTTNIAAGAGEPEYFTM